MVIENNRRKAIEAEKKRFSARLKEIQTDFKNKLIEFSEQKIIRPKHVQQLNMICNHFFVVQSHNDENLNLLETVTSSFINAVTIEYKKVSNPADHILLTDKMQYFISELPQHGIGYNKSFYTEHLPSLLEALKFTPTTDTSEVEVSTEQELSEPT